MTTVTGLKAFWLKIHGETLDLIECCICYTVLFTAHARRHYEAVHPGITFDDPVFDPPRPS